MTCRNNQACTLGILRRRRDTLELNAKCRCIPCIGIRASMELDNVGAAGDNSVDMLSVGFNEETDENALVMKCLDDISEIVFVADYR